MKRGLLVMTVMAGVAQSPLAFSTAAEAPSQPKEERQAQEMLPKASGVVWNTLLGAKIHYADKPPYISATLTPNVKTLAGQTVRMDGFMLPMDSQERSSHFLLSKRTPTCPFCPPGEPNEVIEVFSQKPIKYDDTMLTMEGTFVLTNNTENGIFFQMKKGTLVKTTKVDYNAAAMGPNGRKDGAKDLP